VTKAVSLAAAAATLACTAWMERRGPALWSRPRCCSAAVLLLLPLPAFAYWAVASFETMLFTALLTAAVARLMREGTAGRGHLSALLFAALALTRPEGAFLFAVATAAFALVDHRGAGRRALTRHAGNAALFAIAIAPYALWRWRYYGNLLPNTFYAKVTGDTAQLATGLRHLGEWALEYPLIAAAALLPAVLLSEPGRAALARVPQAAAVYLLVVAHVAYVVLVGGDFMPFFRFFVPILPLGCLLLAWLLGAVAAANPRGAGAALAAAVLVELVTAHAGEQPYRAFVAHRTALIGERVGAWLRAERRPGDLIAVNTAGALPYTSGLPTIDMLGLTDAQIAQRPIYIVSTGWAGHRKGWGAYVLDRQPQVILWYNSAGAREPFYLGDHELADSPLFRFFYRLRTANVPGPYLDGEPIAFFLGTPFGDADGEPAVSRDLGLTATPHASPLPYTALAEGPTTVTYFERDERDAALWPLAQTHAGDAAAFVDAVAGEWALTAQPPPVPGPELVAVQAACEDARRAVDAGRYAEARDILADAARRNAAVHSPLVYQYIANLAVLTGDLFTAVAAQKEALRLVPDSALYRRNLVSLLTVPYREGSRPR
jgi:hypothetical protein